MQWKMSDFTEDLFAALPPSSTQLPDLPLHRFKEAVADRDVDIDVADPDYVLPPQPGALDKPQPEVVGVSLFAPIHDLFRPAHQFFVNKGAANGCFLTQPGFVLPDGLGICQDGYFFSSISKPSVSNYPTVFKALTSKQRQNCIHGLHYAVYPKVRMRREKFDALLREFFDSNPTLCEFRAEADVVVQAKEWDPPIKAAMPSGPHMRYICDALFQYSCTTSNLNSAVLAYFLFHHFGAEDVSLAHLQSMGDCNITRTVALALHEYSPPDAWGESYIADPISMLQATVPSYIYPSCSSSSHDDDDHAIEMRRDKMLC